MESEGLERRLSERLENIPEYRTALQLVTANSSGNIWLIGGGLSRELAALLHGGTVAEHDFDFVVERATEKVVLPKGWQVQTNKYGNPKFVKGSTKIDFIPLATVHSIKRRHLKPTIENLLSGTPFDVQSVALNTKTNKLVGELGLTAIQNKRFGVNNIEQAQFYAEKKGVELTKLIQQKAESMGFTPVTPIAESSRLAGRG
jgi:hypothetical protein